MIQVRRVLRRYIRSKGLRRGGKCSMRLYTEEHLQWVRVVDWANGLPIPNLRDLPGEASQAERGECPPEPIPIS